MPVYTHEWARCIRTLKNCTDFIHAGNVRYVHAETIEEYETEVRRMLRDRNQEIQLRDKALAMAGAYHPRGWWARQAFKVYKYLVFKEIERGTED